MTAQKGNHMIQQWKKTWDQLLTKVHEFPSEDIVRSPAPGMWSIQQVVQHLALSENLSLQYLKKKTLDPAAIPSKDFSYPIRKFLLYLYLASPFKFKAPGMVSDAHFPIEPFETTLEGLQANQLAMLRFLEQLPEKAKTRLVYRHPISGRMDLEGMFQFFTWHIRHHTGQVDRIHRLLKAQGTRPRRPS